LVLADEDLVQRRVELGDPRALALDAFGEVRGRAGRGLVHGGRGDHPAARYVRIARALGGRPDRPGFTARGSGTRGGATMPQACHGGQRSSARSRPEGSSKPFLRPKRGVVRFPSPSALAWRWTLVLGAFSLGALGALAGSPGAPPPLPPWAPGL